MTKILEKIIDKLSSSLDKKSVLGSGQFGVVMKGNMMGEGLHDLRPVAVKSTKSNIDIENFKALLAEIKIMAYLEKHENVVTFLGATTMDIKIRKIQNIPPFYVLT